MRTKKASWLAVALMAALTGLASLHAASDVDPLSQKVAKDWLALIDAGKYEESWSKAHSLFKEKVSKEEWVAGATDMLGRLGELKSRKLKDATATRTLPEAPEGDYTILVYDSAYEHLPAAVDTLITAKDRDGAWRVVGYTVNPGAR
jgi:hypothetical protein